MIKTTQELQDFVIWARQNGVAKIKLKGVEVEFSIAAQNESIIKSLAANESKPESPALPNTAEARAQAEDDQETLFWSVNGN